MASQRKKIVIHPHSIAGENFGPVPAHFDFGWRLGGSIRGIRNDLREGSTIYLVIGIQRKFIEGQPAGGNFMIRNVIGQGSLD